jgi:cytoskeletal protein CcmA (bactofilin family)
VIFRKTNTTPSFSKSGQPKVSGAGKRDQSLSVIAADVNLLGTLVSEGMMDFGGSIDGNLHANYLTIRAGARVNGDVVAESLHVYGKVVGLITAKQVHLYDGCYVEGVVMHETLTMEDGAFLDGKCKRTDKPVSGDVSTTTDSTDNTSEQTKRVMDSIRLIG